MADDRIHAEAFGPSGLVRNAGTAVAARPRPPAAKLHMLGVDDDWTEAYELGLLTRVFNQDVYNLPKVQAGLESGAINEVVFAAGARFLGRSLWKRGDQELIDGVAVNGSAKLVGGVAAILRHVQTGRINTYAVTMIVGVAFLLLFVVLPIVRQ